MNFKRKNRKRPMKIFSDRKMAQNRHFARKNPLRSSQNAAGLKLFFQERDMGQAENGEWKATRGRRPCVVVAGERTAVPGTAPAKRTDHR